MLQVLKIRDFALAGDVEIEFGPGLNVLTGETGAGKSIIVDAVSAVLGGRAGAGDVKEGEERAILEAAFSPSSHVLEILAELDLVPDDADEALILVREISAAGRSKCRVNGRLATVAALAQIGRALVDIHGQHESASLFHAARHIDFLDALGGPGLAPLREEVSRLAKERTDLLAEIAHLKESERERARREDLLRYQIDEIRAARLSPGEEEELEAERARLSHAERLAQGAAEAYAALYEGDGRGASAVDLAGEALRRLQGLAAYDEGLLPLIRSLEQGLVAIQEAARDLKRYQERLVADPGRLGEVEERLHRIGRLKAKYGATLEEVLAFAAAAERELATLESSAELLVQLERRLGRLDEALAQKALELSRARREVAARVSAEIASRLAALNMPRARFEVAFSVDEDPEGIDCGERRLAVTRKGIDRVEFLFSANPGESPKPLARIASGGEMSRVALAIKAAMAEADPVETLVFDEVDAGIGGETAERVADALVQLAKKRQVLVVTHLAQIAARADRHMAVVKEVKGERTTVAVRPLSGEERVWEIARMLDGQATRTSFEHAKALLDMARQTKTAS